MLVKVLNELAPDFVGKVNPWLQLSPESQSYTYFAAKEVDGKVEVLSGKERLYALNKLGRTCYTSSFKEFELDNSFTVDDALAFAQGFYDPNFYSRKEKSFTVPAAIKADFDVVNDHMNYLRDLVNEPAETLTPEKLAAKALARLQQSAQFVGKEEALSYTLTSFDELLEKGFVGTHTVGRGSANKPCLLEVDFNPSKDPQAPTYAALVGKGVTFDTGGYSLKPDAAMSTMRSDMGGSALMSATLALAIAQGLNKRVKLFLSCAENMVSSNAFRLGDIIEYPNGVTACVDNTDAEGRLVLADSLILASKANNGRRPELIIDAATLTGAAKVAVGTDYHSLLSFDDALVNGVLAVAEEQNERFWRLPFEDFHRDQVSSPYATISNTGAVMQSPGASTAAAFLSYFVEDYKNGWLHIDASSTFNRRGGQEVALGATGRGLRTLATFLVK